MRAPIDVKPFLGKPDLHWKVGRSAYELATSWLAADGVPTVVRAVLDQAPEWRSASLNEAAFEKQVELRTRGAASQTDLMAYMSLADGPGILAIEGKVTETFGQRVDDTGMSKGQKARAADLCGMLGISIADAGSLRYQLLHRTASAVIEAQRIKARHAMMLVHSFDVGQAGRSDFETFAQKLGVSGAGANRISSSKTIEGVELRLAWVADRPHHPRVEYFALGGTIATMPAESGAMKQGLGADDLIRMVPALAEVADVRGETIERVGSSNLTVDLTLKLAQRIEALPRAGADAPVGVVVSQGTDTLEETSFILDCVLDAGLPVSLTAAMRNPRLTSADGAGNLLASVRVASSAWMRQHVGEIGVVVTFLDHVYAPFDVVKSETSRIDTFRSPATGPLATLVEDRVIPLSLPVRDWKRAVDAALGPKPSTRLLAAGRKPVALLWAAMDDTGGLLDALLADPGHLGYAGIVFAGTGGGHVPEVLVERLVRLNRSIPVLIAPRTGAGPLLAATYEGPGSEIGLRQAGMIFCGRLHPLKSRLLLELLLRAGVDRSGIARVFASCG
ncbi:MAG: asparaginase [Alphaproteobacteria bacterium]|nr:asparaginase [Alphaproteobacteria bacterium]MCW5740664.1 asparaginase [Alphaproteobacteria bacterium]